MIRIAIVEDDTGYRSQLGKYIDQYQSDFSETVSVSEFSDGLEIVEKYKSEYDIILMDIQMKHMDGMQAAMRIRDMDKNVIIIFITNVSNTRAVQQISHCLCMVRLHMIHYENRISVQMRQQISFQIPLKPLHSCSA